MPDKIKDNMHIKNNLHMKDNLQDKRFLIIGLGLIGGSLARALKVKIGVNNINAIDTNIANLKQAVAEGIINNAFSSPDIEYAWDTDVIFICTPVSSCIKYLDIITARANKKCIVTDVCSTKYEIMHKINTLTNPPCFIGGHPMAGSEYKGYSAGYAHMFENAYYILTPSKTATPEALELVTSIVKGIGAIPVILDADEHDRITGSISHVPHIIASALVNMVRDIDNMGKMQLLAAGGFKDITRIASSNPEIWKSIICSNKQHITNLLNLFVKILENFGKIVSEENEDAIYNFFNKAKSFRDSLPESSKTLIPPLFDIVVDVVDEPGIIGKIATILGDNGINIKNINVSNSREYEQGCLKITFADQESAKQSKELLSKAGYKVY